MQSAKRYCAAHPQPSNDAKKVCDPHNHAISVMVK